MKIRVICRRFATAEHVVARTYFKCVFQDEALRALIKETLTNNYDMQIAASSILQAQGWWE